MSPYRQFLAAAREQGFRPAEAQRAWSEAGTMMGLPHRVNPSCGCKPCKQARTNPDIPPIVKVAGVLAAVAGVSWLIDKLNSEQPPRKGGA